MKSHDLKQSADALQKQADSVVQKQADSVVAKISPEFHSMSLDLQEIMSASQNPAVVSALLYKLIQEREQSNKILSQINEKYDALMFEWKTHAHAPAATHSPSGEQVLKNNWFEVLPEQDQMILNLIDDKGNASAETVRSALGYKGLNAACQRLNKLYKEGYLKKIQSGKKVMYLSVR